MTDDPNPPKNAAYWKRLAKDRDEQITLLCDQIVILKDHLAMMINASINPQS